MVSQPYVESTSDNGSIVRIFSSAVPSGELKWHWDEEDRLVELLEPTDWLFQIDNSLPVDFPDSVLIKSGVWHRVIKGDKNLVVRIKGISDKSI